MENIFNYYEFSDFFKDNSSSFKGSSISYTVLNEQHFLIFEKCISSYNLFVARYQSESEIGIQKPQILELLVENYDKSIPEHRITLRQYLG